MQPIKNTTKRAVNTARQRVLNTLHDQLAGVLPHETLRTRLATHGGGIRSRVYPPLVTLGLFVEQVIGFDSACQDATGRALSWRCAWDLPASSLNTGPYCKARQRLPLPLIEDLTTDVADQAAIETGQRDRRVLLIDGTTVSMPDTPELQRVFPQNHQQRAGVGFPLARIVGVICLSSACVLHWRVSACEGAHSHESQHVWHLLDQFRPGDIVVADRAYASYFLLAALKQRGIDFVIRQHQRRHTDLDKALRLGPRDHLVSWHKPKRPRWMSAETYAALPADLSIREVGDGRLIATTSLTEPASTSAADIIKLYRQRWHIELDFRAIKDVMDMSVLRCKSPAMIVKEIAVYLLGYNLIRAVMAQAASVTTPVRRLSFAAARRAVTELHARRRHAPQWPLRNALNTLHQWIAYHTVPSRPGRAEPRAAKRRPKPHRLLNQPRSIARQRLQAA